MGNDIIRINIRGVMVPFNWFDMENREKYAKANKVFQERLSELDKAWESIDEPTEEQEIEHFKNICTAVHDLFRALVGDETTEKIFRGKYDYFACMDAIASLVNAKERQARFIEEIASSPKLDVIK